MYANINGTKIFYDIAGMKLRPHHDQFKEVPTLFLLHGGPGGDHLRYKIHSLELEKVAQLVFIDYRGCGRSQKSKRSDYTQKNNVADIEALRKYLGLEKIVLLGTSYGGMVAIDYALKYQQHLDKLILVATAPSYRFMQSARDYLQKNGTRAQIKIAEKLWQANFKNEKEVKHFFKIMEPLYTRSHHQQKKYAYSKSSTQWSYEALNEGFKNFLRTYDFIPNLHKIKVPTLILAGDQDWICRPEQAKLIAKHIPNAKIKIFRGAGHALAIDAHKGYIRKITQFLR